MGDVRFERPHREVIEADDRAAAVRWSRHDLMGHDLCDLLHRRRQDGSPLPPGECRIQCVLERGDIAYVEEGDVFMRKDGSAFPVAYAAAPVLLEGEIRGMVLVFRDVTQRSLEWQALRAREERLRRLTEASLEALVVHDGERVLDANTAAVGCFGRAREDLVGMPVRDVIAPEFRHEVGSAIAESRDVRGVIDIVRANGEPFKAEVDAKTISSGGEAVRVVAIRER